jgi:hypothetical protein
MSSLGRFVLVAFILVIVFVPSARAADTSSIDRHVRVADPDLSGLLRTAIAQSPSIRLLVTRLDESDVIVYVKRDHDLPSGLVGQLTFIGRGGGRRYVVISLGWGLSEQRSIATLGHELQHASEVAGHAEIVDLDSFARAFATFGEASHGVRPRGALSFETAAAVAAGNRVWKELARAGAPEDLYAAGVKP